MRNKRALKFVSKLVILSGWRGNTRISRGVGIQTMDWCTAVTSKRHRRSSLSFKLAWRSAAWRWEDQNRLLQRKKAQRQVSERQI